jgi:hypothetical protein
VWEVEEGGVDGFVAKQRTIDAKHTPWATSHRWCLLSFQGNAALAQALGVRGPSWTETSDVGGFVAKQRTIERRNANVALVHVVAVDRAARGTC